MSDMGFEPKKLGSAGWHLSKQANSMQFVSLEYFYVSGTNFQEKVCLMWGLNPGHWKLLSWDWIKQSGTVQFVTLEFFFNVSGTREKEKTMFNVGFEPRRLKTVVWHLSEQANHMQACPFGIVYVSRSNLRKKACLMLGLNPEDWKQ